MKTMKAIVLLLLIGVGAVCTAERVDCAGKTCKTKEACLIKFGPYRPEACYPLGSLNAKCDDLAPIEGKFKMNPPCGSGLKCVATNTGSYGPRNKRCKA